MKTVLTIAGSDASGGAGIQADIKTLTVHKVYATSCITALTAQNTKGITGIMPVPSDFFEKQLDSVFSDIKPDAVKIRIPCLSCYTRLLPSVNNAWKFNTGFV